MPREKAGEKSITVQSMVGAQTGLAAVMLRLGDQYVNLPPEQARQIGGQLLEAAYASELDAALAVSLRRAGLDEAAVAALLRSLREQRPGGR